MAKDATPGGSPPPPRGDRGRVRIDRRGMTRAENTEVLRAYWRRNLRLTVALLSAWFVVGYVLAILMAPALNRITFLGGPFGFWFAQNGAIYLFWLLILIYAVAMNRLDHEFDVEE